MAPGSSSASPCGRSYQSRSAEILVGLRQRQPVRPEVGLPDRAYPAILVRKQSMKSRGELGSREAWWSRTLRGMKSFMRPKFWKRRRCVRAGHLSRRLGKMYHWGWGRVGGVWRSSRVCASEGQGARWAGAGSRGAIKFCRGGVARGLCVSGDPTREWAWAWLSGAV